MPAFVALLRGPRAGGVLLALLLALSVGLPAVVALSAPDSAAGAGDGPSIGVLSTAALTGLHRLLLADAPVRLEAPLPAALLVGPFALRGAGEAGSADDKSPRAASPRAPATPLRI